MKRPESHPTGSVGGGVGGGESISHQSQCGALSVGKHRHKNAASVSTGCTGRAPCSGKEEGGTNGSEQRYVTTLRKTYKVHVSMGPKGPDTMRSPSHPNWAEPPCTNAASAAAFMIDVAFIFFLQNEI